MKSQFYTSRGQLFHSLTVEGTKELRYCVVLECIVRMLCALRGLYVDRVSLVGGITEERYAGERLFNILYRRKSLCYLTSGFLSFPSDFFVKGV